MRRASKFAAGGAPDISAGAELAHVFRLGDAGADGAVLQRGGIVVKLDQPRKPAPRISASKALIAAAPPGASRGPRRRARCSPSSAGGRRRLARRATPVRAARPSAHASARRQRRCRWRRYRRGGWRSAPIRPSARADRRRAAARSLQRRFHGEREGKRISDRAVAARCARQAWRRYRAKRPPSATRCPCAHSRAAAPAAPVNSPLAVKRKWPGSMMPACTGPTGI